MEDLGGSEGMMPDELNPHTLQAWRREGVTLAEALAAARGALGPDAVGFFSSAARHVAARLESGAWTTRQGPDARVESLRLEEFHEARVFAAGAELRFVHDAGGRGRAVFFAEQQPDGPLSWTATPLRHAGEPIHGGYLLWGRVVASGGGWSRLAEGRLGAFWVPASLPQDASARVKTCEYVALDEHGNAGVVEERLLALESAEAR